MATYSSELDVLRECRPFVTRITATSTPTSVEVREHMAIVGRRIDFHLRNLGFALPIDPTTDSHEELEDMSAVGSAIRVLRAIDKHNLQATELQALQDQIEQLQALWDDFMDRFMNFPRNFLHDVDRSDDPGSPHRPRSTTRSHKDLPAYSIYNEDVLK